MRVGPGLALAAVAAGVLVAGAPARADHDTLLGALLGGGAGAAIGGAVGGGRGAAIGGVLGLTLGALSANELANDRYPYYGRYDYYQPRGYYYRPPPGYYYAPPAYGYAPPQQYYVAAPRPAAPYLPPAAYDRSYCREFTGRVTIEGREVTSHGIACRQPDGTWRIVN
jgi:hypothetical protein